MQLSTKAKLTAEIKRLERRHLDLIEQIAEVEARHEKSAAEFERLNAQGRGRLVANVPPRPELIAAREAYTRDITTLETLDAELADVEKELRRVRTGLASDDITAAAEAKLANLRETMMRQQAATATRRVALDNLRKAHDAALAELADLESKAAADLVAAAERGEPLTGGADTTATVSAHLRSLESGIVKAEALVADCEAAEAATRRDIETAESEADHARALAAEFEALQVLRAALPAVAHWKASARRAFGYGGWRCPELDEMVRAYEQETA